MPSRIMVAWVLSIGLGLAAAAFAEEKPLFGFEKRQVAGWARLTHDTETDYSVYHGFTAAAGDVTEGKLALVRRIELHFYRTHYANGRWVLGPKVILESGIRHCADRLALLRDAGERLWAVWDHLNRLGRYAIHVKYSDDDGATWKDTGQNGRIRWDFRGLPAGPFLVRDGPYVACFRRQPDSPTRWSRFDGMTWSKPQAIGRRTCPVSAVTVAGHIYLATRRPPQVLRFDGEAWVPDSPPGPGTGLLCRSGDRVVCLWHEKAADAPDTIYCSVKRGGGQWSPPKAVAAEPGAIEGLAAPRHAPDTFVPIAWSDKTRRWIKTHRIRFDAAP